MVLDLIGALEISFQWSDFDQDHTIVLKKIIRSLVYWSCVFRIENNSFLGVQNRKLLFLLTTKKWKYTPWTTRNKNSHPWTHETTPPWTQNRNPFGIHQLRCDFVQRTARRVRLNFFFFQWCDFDHDPPYRVMLTKIIRSLVRIENFFFFWTKKVKV